MTSLSRYTALIQALLETPEVQSMDQWDHHLGVSCFQHSVFVSYIAWRLAPRFGVDPYLAARAGLLHDLYLYEPYDPTAHPGSQCFYHPVAALANAKRLVPDLSPQEENSILTHMWPLATHMPRCRLAIVVNLADKFCATVELLKIYKRLKLWAGMPKANYPG